MRARVIATYTYDGKMKHHVTSYGDATFVGEGFECGDVLQDRNAGPPRKPADYAVFLGADGEDYIWVQPLDVWTNDGLGPYSTRRSFWRKAE